MKTGETKRTMKFGTVLLALCCLGGTGVAGAVPGPAGPAPAASAEETAPPDLSKGPHEFRPPHPRKHDKTEEEGNATPDTFSLNYLYNQRNGAVQTDPRIYLVFWGDWSSAGDPSGALSRLYWFYKGLGSTTYGQVLSQYQQGCTPGTWSCSGAHAGNPAAPFKSWWNDTSFVPTTPTMDQMAAEARRAAAVFGDYSRNAQYVIALPRGHGDTRFIAKGGNACGWHSLTAVGSSWFTYTSLPYQPDAPVCWQNSVNGSSAGILDGETIVAGHEYAESVTDPGLNAWYDAKGDENGDKCSLSAFVSNRTLSTGTFPMQATWSNYHRYYFNSGCRYGW